MLLDHAQGRVHVARRQWFWHAGATRVTVSFERAHDAGDFGGLFVSVAGHNSGDGSRQRTAQVGIVRQPIAHDQ